MRKTAMIKKLTALLIIGIFILQGCFKDSVTKRYTIYTPVYKTKAEVRAGIKSSAPIAVENPGKLFVLGNYIFLNEINKGVHVIDNTNPAAPVNKYFINIPGNIDLAVTGNILYADMYTDLVTLDISNPTSVQIKKFTPAIFPNRIYTNGFVADTSRIITEWVAKDTVVDVNAPSYNVRYQYMFLSSDQSGSSFTKSVGIGGSMARFTLLNNYLYTVSDVGLKAFDITQPENPILSSNINIGSNIETIYPFKNNLFIGSQTGMLIYSVTNPAQPAKISSFTHARRCDPVIADDNFAYVTLSTGTTCGGSSNSLDVVNIQNLTSTYQVRSYPLINPHGLCKDGATLFVCDGSAGLKIYDATIAGNLQLLQTITGLDAYDVIAVNGVAIVVGKDGLYEYDYSNRSNTKLISKISYN